MKNVFIALLLTLPIALFAQGDCLKIFSGLSQIHEFSETDRLLLISSNQGLFVIDKAKLEVINYFDEFGSGLPNRQVRGATVDQAGTIWIISGNQIVSIIDGQATPRLDLTNQLSDEDGTMPTLNQIVSLDEDIYLLTSPAGVFKIKKNKKVVRLKMRDDGAPSKNIWKYNDDIWVGTMYGLARIEKRKVVPPKDAPHFLNRSAFGVVLDKELNSWTYRDKVISRYNKDGHKFFKLAKGPQKEPLKYPIDDIFNDQSGNVYALADGVVFQYADEEWVQVAHSYLTKPIQYAFVDKFGEVWAYGNRFGGLKVYRDGSWQRVKLPGLDSQFKQLSQVSIHGDRVLARTLGQVYTCDGKGVYPLFDQRFDQGRIYTLSDSTFINIGKERRGSELTLKMINIKNSSLLQSSKVKGTGVVVDIGTYRDTVLFVASNTEYFYLPESNLIKIRGMLNADGSRTGKVKKVRWDENGNAWAWCEEGLFHRKVEGQWYKYVTDDDVIYRWDGVKTFELSPQGIPMVLYVTNVYALDVEQMTWQRVAKLPVKTVGCKDPFYMAIVDTNHFWIGRRYKIYQYKDQEWEMLIKDDLRSRHAWMYNLIYEPSEECLYLGTNNELVKYAVNCEQEEWYAQVPSVDADETEPSPQVSDSEFNLKVTTYPNPFVNEVNIEVESSSNSPIFIMLYDNIGRLLYSKRYAYKSSMYTLTNQDGLSPGAYFIRVQQNDHQLTKKMIKVRE